MTDKLEQPNNAVLEVQLKYIQKDISEIKADVKEIKSDFIPRREFETFKAEIEAKVAVPTKFVYWIIGVFGIAILGAIINLVLKK